MGAEDRNINRLMELTSPPFAALRALGRRTTSALTPNAFTTKELLVVINAVVATDCPPGYSPLRDFPGPILEDRASDASNLGPCR
jgi:hypothetical protein